MKVENGGKEERARVFSLLFFLSFTCRTGGAAPPPRAALGPAPRMWVRKAATSEGLEVRTKAETVREEGGGGQGGPRAARSLLSLFSPLCLPLLTTHSGSSR